MLSYRHGFHAGNPADVLKHVVLVRCLQYLNQKDKPYCFIDTHAGAGRYRLDDAFAQKTGEYEQGIARLWHQQKHPAVLEVYLDLVKQLNASGQLVQYPGSPWFARSLMRENDRALLFEMHSKDYATLKRYLEKPPRIEVRREDGFGGCLSVLPPKERRGLVLMDPSYEVKEDYQQVIRVLEQAYRRFATGNYLIWYPVVDRARTAAMERALKRTGIRNIALFELGSGPDTPGRGMSASGVVVVNPPWTLMAEMKVLLPYLVGAVAPELGRSRAEALVAE